MLAKLPLAESSDFARRVRWPGKPVGAALASGDPEDRMGYTKMTGATPYRADVWDITGSPRSRENSINFSYCPLRYRDVLKDFVLLRSAPGLANELCHDEAAVEDFAGRTPRVLGTSVPNSIRETLNAVEVVLTQAGGVWPIDGWQKVVDRWNDAPGTIATRLSNVRVFHRYVTIAFGLELPFPTPFDGESLAKLLDLREENSTQAEHAAMNDLLFACIHLLEAAGQDVLDRLQWYAENPDAFVPQRGNYKSSFDPRRDDPYNAAHDITDVVWLPDGYHLLPTAFKRGRPKQRINAFGGLRFWSNRLVEACGYIVCIVTGLRWGDVLTIEPDTAIIDTDDGSETVWWQLKGMQGKAIAHRLSIHPVVVAALRWVMELNDILGCGKVINQMTGRPTVFHTGLVYVGTGARLPKAERREHRTLLTPSRILLGEALNDIHGLEQDSPHAVKPINATTLNQTTLERAASRHNGAVAVQATRHHHSMAVSNGYIGSTPKTMGPDPRRHPNQEKVEEERWMALTGRALIEAISDPDSIGGPAADALKAAGRAARSRLGVTKGDLALMMRKRRKQMPPEAQMVQNGPIAVCTAADKTAGACGGAGLEACVHGCELGATTAAHRAMNVLKLRQDKVTFARAPFLVKPREDHLSVQAPEEMAMTDEELIDRISKDWTDEDKNRWGHLLAVSTEQN